jgi:hypothetical protein
MAMLVTATSGGTTYDLTDLERYLWIEDEGLGMAPLHRIIERGPQQHGDTDLGFRLDARQIKLVVGVFGTDDADYWNARTELLQVFAPSDDPVQLCFTLPNGAVRQIDTFVAGDFQLGSKDRTRLAHKVGIVLRCPDPTFYDPTMLSLTYGVSGATAGFTVPMAVPTGIGSTTINTIQTITYQGSWRDFPFIRVKGPITSPVVWNVTTDERLDFTGTTISAGDYYDIDCRYGYKTVVDAAGVNRIDKLISTNDLNTFHLAPHPEATSGGNDIRVTGTSITNATEVYIQYFHRYLGI